MTPLSMTPPPAGRGTPSPHPIPRASTNAPSALDLSTFPLLKLKSGYAVGRSSLFLAMYAAFRQAAKSILPFHFSFFLSLAFPSPQRPPGGCGSGGINPGKFWNLMCDLEHSGALGDKMAKLWRPSFHFRAYFFVFAGPRQARAPPPLNTPLHWTRKRHSCVPCLTKLSATVLVL